MQLISKDGEDVLHNPETVHEKARWEAVQEYWEAGKERFRRAPPAFKFAANIYTPQFGQILMLSRRAQLELTYVPRKLARTRVRVL